MEKLGRPGAAGPGLFGVRTRIACPPFASGDVDAIRARQQSFDLLAKPRSFRRRWTWACRFGGAGVAGRRHDQRRVGQRIFCSVSLARRKFRSPQPARHLPSRRPAERCLATFTVTAAISGLLPHHQDRTLGIADHVSGIGPEEVCSHRRSMRTHHDQIGAKSFRFLEHLVINAALADRR
jgi:hypothetical protein